MSVADDDFEWSAGRMASDTSLQECSSARVTIDGITHRVLNEGAGWETLCGSHRFICFAGKTLVPSDTNRAYDFSTADVDCLCCIPAGG